MAANLLNSGSMTTAELEEHLEATVDATSGSGVTRHRRWFRRILSTIVLLAAATLLGMYGTSVYFLQKIFTHRVEKLQDVPQGFGLAAESIALTSSDGIPLKAWWVPADPTHGAVVVLHGMDGLDASCLLP